MRNIVTREEPKASTVTITRPDGQDPETLFIQGDINTEALIKAIEKSANGKNGKTRARKQAGVSANDKPFPGEVAQQAGLHEPPKRRGRKPKAWPESQREVTAS